MEKMLDLVLFYHLAADHHFVIALTQLVGNFSEGDVLLAED